MATFTSYTDWYNLPENDPYHGDYSILFPTLTIQLRGGNAAPLLTSLAVGADSKAAIAFLATDGLIHIIHRVRRYTPALGMAPAAYDNGDFGTFDDTTLTGPSTVELPATLLSPLPATVPVLTAAEISLQVLATPAQGQYQPAADVAVIQARLDAGEMSEVRTRIGMLIPPDLTGRMLAAVISPGGLTPRKLWINYVQPLAQHPQFPHLTPFIDWARLAYAYGIGQNNALALPLPAIRHLEPALGAERRKIYELDFPHLHHVGVPGVAPLVAELVATRMDAAARDNQRRAQDLQQKLAASLPSKRWGAALTRLLRLCQVGAETDLPLVWQEMAQNGVKADITTIRAHLDTPQPDLGPSGSAVPPVCTPEMAKSLGRLEFQTHVDAIEAGIHIFGVCHPTQESAMQANELAGIFAEHILGVTGLTIVESVAMKQAQKLLLPASLLELKHVLFGYHRFLSVILAPHHPVVIALGLLTARLQLEEMTFHLYFARHLSRCASVLRFVQRRMFYWIRKQLLVDDMVPAPDFVCLLDQIEQDCWMPPPLPSAYTAAPPPNPRPAAAPIAAPNPLAAPTPTAAPATGRADALFDVAPALLDPNVREMKGFHPVRFIASHGPPPPCAAGGEMCLNFHVRHRCRLNCPRSADHVRHTAAETTHLNTYLASPILPVTVATPPVAAN